MTTPATTTPQPVPSGTLEQTLVVSASGTARMVLRANPAPAKPA
jgi:hypothetical protein